ncbi:MAG: peptidase M24 [Betaproteobacteria bacterium RIFCSPLOWO2_12_FULL_65_14]|nr:MAG: peptidase M24 [Betaproteobacteria bacterium RIFCSPLOWO2_12_FULL_65_14]
MREDIINRLKSAMREHGWDAVICCSPENYAYVTGFVVPSQPLMRWRHAMVVVKADGTRALLSVDMETSTVRKHAGSEEIRVWKEFSFDAMEQLARLLLDLGLARARVGIEMDYLPAGDFEGLQKLANGIDWQPAESALARLRQNKTEDEIALLRRLSMIADKSIKKAFEAVKAGSTELDIAGALTRSIYDEGAEYFKLMIVATGERSVLPNVGPTERVLKDRDICRVEIFPIIGGYHAGVCRTAQVGSAPPHAEDIWQKLVECKYMLLEQIRPGAICRDIYRSYCRKLEALGLPLISFVGHGIGLHLHEDPYLGEFCGQPLESGMVLGIEPLIYETGHGYGMQNKDMVLVTEKGCELLSAHTNTDHLIRVAA